MNNNQINFDPMTGQPINQNNTPTPDLAQQNNFAQVQQQPVPAMQPAIQPTTETQPIVTNQQQMQNIPTIEQSKQEFINNTQANNNVKQEEKKDGPNIMFIIILFAIIFASIFFLFPYLLEVL